MGKVYCAACQKRCKGDVLKIEQHFVHPKCFRCAKCATSLQQGGFFVRNKRLYCPGDYQAEFGVKCAQCNNFVEGEVVTVLGKTFHPDCFRCFGCGRLFTSGERATIVNEAYYCSVCSSLVASNPAGPVSPTKVSPDALFPDRGGRHSNTLPPGLPPVTANGSAGDQLTDRDKRVAAGLRDAVAPTGQLMVQINENGYTHLDSTSAKMKSITLNHHQHQHQPQHHHFDQAIDPSTLDTMLSTTPGQTYSGVGFSSPGTLSTTNTSAHVRTCPPGVDYGRHYPLSYLRLAEHGLTAIMTGDELLRHPPTMRHQLRSRSLAHPTMASSPHRHLLTATTAADNSNGHQSRSATRSAPLCKPGQVCNGASSSTGIQQVDDHHHHHHRQQQHLTQPASELPSGTTTVPSQGSSWIWQSTTSGRQTPVSDARPKRDLYVRQRQLSPGAASLSCGLVGYHLRSPRPTGSTMQTRNADRSTHRSTPNVCAKRGMTLLAESLMQPRPRPDRSQSPDSSATEYWMEARRLASYPSARLPDSNSLPAIERLDFPAPPSPAVVMLERRREKRLTLQRERELAAASKSQNGESAAGLDDSLSDGDILSADLSKKINRIDAEIEKLKRLGDNSGMTMALIQELQSSKQAYLHEPDLDPVSASRSPSANQEPDYKTRYDQHGFASPSRDNRRVYRSANRHTLSYAMDYSRTGGRSGTVPNNSLVCSTSTPRPGYTAGILYGRAVSLPRSVASPLPNGGMGVGVGVVGSGVRGTQPTTGSRGLSQFQASRTLPGGCQSGRTPGSMAVGARPRADSFGVQLDLEDSVHTGDPLRSATDPPFERSGIASLATSALSVDGLTVTEEVTGMGNAPGRRSTTLDTRELTAAPSSYYCLKAGTLAGGLPPSVTGLRPVARYRRSNTLGVCSGYRRGAGELRDDGGDGVREEKQEQDDQATKTVTLPLISEIDTCPSVQDWLRPTSGKLGGHRSDTASFKVHPYEQLRMSSGQPPLKGVDRTRLELHLSTKEFQALFQMPLSSFQRLPEWKRNDLKKKVDLL